MNLTKYERETVVNMNDEDDFAIVTTNQRRVITQLRNNPAAEERDSPYAGGYAQFTIPARLVRFGKPRKLSDETRAKLADNARKAQQGRLFQ